MHITPGPTRYAVRNVDTAESTFQLFLTPSLLQQIIVWTNKEGRLVYGHQWADVDNIEMNCYLGLLILAGVMKGHNESVMSLWNEENGRAILFLVDRWHVTDSQPYQEQFGSMMRLHVVVQVALT